VITALLVRWSGGHLEVDAGDYEGVREEAFFKAGDSQYPEDAVELATAVLEGLGGENESIDVTFEGAFVAAVGDTLIAPDVNGSARTWRVVGIDYSHDREGNVTRKPTLEIIG
jgi:hypothetical protein